MKSIKQIIREEINDFDWIKDIKPYSFSDIKKGDIIKLYLNTDIEQFVENFSLCAFTTDWLRDTGQLINNGEWLEVIDIQHDFIYSEIYCSGHEDDDEFVGTGIEFKINGDYITVSHYDVSLVDVQIKS